MTKLEFYLFDTVKIIEDKCEIIMPVGKPSGILFYLLQKKIVSRDTIAGMFWPDSNDYNSKTSLRNALYKIKSYFKSDIILTPNNSILALNEDINIFIDIEEFEKDPVNNLDFYTGEFLNGFFIKDSEEFELWIIECRAFYRELYIRNLVNRINNKIEIEGLKNVLSDINKLLSVDLFNEFAYLNLMRYYEEKCRYDKLINTYYKYKTLLEDELGAEPSDEIENIRVNAEKIIVLSKVKPEKESQEKLYNRDFEIRLIQENINDYISGKNYKSVLILGEHGIGKTSLIDNIINQNKNKIIFLETKCRKSEQNFSYSPWRRIIQLVRDYINNNVSYETKIKSQTPDISTHENLNPLHDFKDNLEEILKHRMNFMLDLFFTETLKLSDVKIVIVIEDLQWADQDSIDLLSHLIMLPNNIMFLITSSDDDSCIKMEFSPIAENGMIDIIQLDRFSKVETGYIVKNNFERNISEKEIQDFYEESNGNPFYLKEYIKQYEKASNFDISDTKIYDFLHEKFSVCGSDEKQVLYYMSAFHSEISIFNLTEIFANYDIDILKIINSLYKKKIVAIKIINNSTCLNFTFKAYREYFYKAMNPAARHIIHKNIADTIENNLESGNLDVKLLFKLRFHYEKANYQVKVLKYSIYILKYYLYFNHEIFPDVSSYSLEEDDILYIDNERSHRWIKSIEDDIVKIKCLNIANIDTKELKQLEMEFLIIKGRFSIRTGNYKNGVDAINKVIKISKELQILNFELEGHKQIIYYGIQISDTNLMLEHIKLGLNIANRIGDEEEIGVLNRLQGLYYMMVGNALLAENYFDKAISYFNSSGLIRRNNPIDIAAIYNYLGEIRLSQLRHKEALVFFHKALNTCEGLEATCISIFYLNLGITSFLLDDIEAMKEYFLKAQQIFKTFSCYWKSSTLNAFLSLIKFIDKDYESSYIYLQMASEISNAIQDPRDIGIVYMIKTIIKLIMDRDKDDYGNMNDLLNFPIELYYYKAQEFLDGYRDLALKEYLEECLHKGMIGSFENLK